MTKQPDPSLRVLDQLGRVIRQLARVSGGPDEGPALTATQRLALYELSEDGPMRLSDLAARMGTSAPTTSRAIDALAEGGLVERTTDPSDRRALRLELTATGKSHVDLRKARVADAFHPAAAAALPASEREQLAELLLRLADELARLDRG